MRNFEEDSYRPETTPARTSERQSQSRLGLVSAFRTKDFAPKWQVKLDRLFWLLHAKSHLYLHYTLRRDVCLPLSPEFRRSSLVVFIYHSACQWLSAWFFVLLIHGYSQPEVCPKPVILPYYRSNCPNSCHHTPTSHSTVSLPSIAELSIGSQRCV